MKKSSMVIALALWGASSAVFAQSGSSSSGTQPDAMSGGSGAAADTQGTSSGMPSSGSSGSGMSSSGSSGSGGYGASGGDNWTMRNSGTPSGATGSYNRGVSGSPGPWGTYPGPRVYPEGGGHQER